MKRTSLKVEEFADVYSGGTPSTNNGVFWDGGIPWITPKDLAGYEAMYIASGERDISEEGLRNSSARLLPEDTVLLTTRAPIGYVALASSPLATNQGFKNIVCKPNLAVPAFVYYQLKYSTALLESHATGSTFKELSGSRLKAIEFQLPDTATQQRIAEILSAYDDLIDNNRRRMALLEDAARQLYREWFVRLRFPGHEHTRITDGVPDGWKRKKLGDLAEITIVQSPESQYYNEVGDGLPFHQGVTDFGDRFVRNRVYCTAQNRVAEAGDILCSVRAPVGRLNITLDRIVIGRGLDSLRSKFKRQSLLFQQLRTHFFKEDLIGTGAIFASVTKKEFEGQELLDPTVKMADAFEEISRPIDEEIGLLVRQNEKLRAARDLLLPRLMNGEIVV